MLANLRQFSQTLSGLARGIPAWIPLLFVRLAVFTVFWRSVQTKITGWTVGGQHFAFWNVTDSAKLLFKYEYDLPLIPSDTAAYLGTFAEFFLPLMVLLGVAARLGALGLITVTATIQFLVYPEAWSVHILWFALLLTILRDGAGKASVDGLLGRV